VFAETTETPVQGNVWSGVYQGFTPCEDCKGVKTTLALNKNNSYILISQYVGKSEKEIVEKGKFAEGNESNTIVLTPRNSSQVRYYAIGENTLTQLDENGNRVTGKLAERYVLRKNELRQPQNQGSHH
jgi:copper homeostasis protein (lipoprotein)